MGRGDIAVLCCTGKQDTQSKVDARETERDVRLPSRKYPYKVLLPREPPFPILVAIKKNIKVDTHIKKPPALRPSCMGVEWARSYLSEKKLHKPELPVWGWVEWSVSS